METVNKASVDMIPISIVICTIEHSGREERLAEVIDNLKRQSGVALEIILVWQGSNEALLPKFENVRVLMTGLCSSGESRNRGADLASHDLISFYDDDTFPIEKTMIHDAVNLLRERNLDFLTCNIKSIGRMQSSTPATADVILTRRSVIEHMWEPGMLVTRAAFRAVRFDPTLGIGCVHGSSEGMDFGFRLLAAGFQGQRIASLLVDHPPLASGAAPMVERVFFYSIGNGATLLQHGYRWLYIRALFRTSARIVVSLITGKSVDAMAAFVRIPGLLAGPLLPRRPARMLPPNASKKFDKIGNAID